MSASMNGRTIIPSAPSPLLQTVTVALRPTGSLSTQVAAGDAGTVLAEVARRFNADVEPLQTFYGWRSLATNTASGGIANSNHLSGTAIDLNGAWHPRYHTGTFSAAQVAAIRRILADLPGVGWGGNYPAYEVDEMHFEIVGAASVVSATANSLTTAPIATPIVAPTGPITVTTPQEDIMAGPTIVQVVETQAFYLADVPGGVFVALDQAEVDGLQAVADTHLPLRSVTGAEADGARRAAVQVRDTPVIRD